MLDEIGLTHRDAEGYRTFPDGTRMTFYLDFTSDFTGEGPGQFVVDDWASVGVRVILRDRSRVLFYTEKDAMEFDFNVWTGESDYMPILSPRYFIPKDGESFYAVAWGRGNMAAASTTIPYADAPGCPTRAEKSSDVSRRRAVRAGVAGYELKKRRKSLRMKRVGHRRGKCLEHQHRRRPAAAGGRQQ